MIPAVRCSIRTIPPEQLIVIIHLFLLTLLAVNATVIVNALLDFECFFFGFVYLFIFASCAEFYSMICSTLI